MNFIRTKNILKISLLALSLLVSCAGKKGKTNSSFKLTLGAISSAYVTGGLMLYGKMLNGPSRFGKRIDASGTATLELSNGNWEFFAIAWDGANDMTLTPTTGVLRCGKATGSFAGGDVSVAINLDNATCNDSIFHKDTTKIDTTTFSPNVAFPATNIMTCDRNWVAAPTFYGSFNCDGVGFGAVDSYKVYLPEFIDEGGGLQIVNLGLQSDCQETNPSNSHPTVSASGATNNFAARFPIGRPGSPFLTIVKGYFGSIDCGTTKVARGFLDRIFPEGVGAAPLGFHDTGTSNFRLFDQVQDGEVCGVTGGAANANDFFSAGNGLGHPYIICSRQQMEAFANPTNYNSVLTDDTVALKNAHYKLYAPIDFGGSAFDGIGDGILPYTGQFAGRKYVISNIFNMSLADVDNIGLFRYVGSGAKIDDLILRNIFLECDDTNGDGDCGQMGALAGQVDGGIGTPTTFSNIKVQGYIFGGQNVGGVFGLINANSTGTNISDVHFVGAVESEPQGASISNVGGIVGSADKTYISVSSANCHISADGTNAGGLVGSYIGAGTIDSTTARCEVRADRVLGGLVGFLGSGTTLMNSYSFPIMQANCSGGCDASANRVNMGGLVGENYGSITLSLAAYESLSMNSGGGTNDAMAFMGGLVGLNSGTCSATNNFFTKFDNNSIVVFGATNGGGCGTYLNSSTIYSFSNYQTNGWSIINSVGAGPTWNHPSGGFDVPRLAWEYSKELEIPYLQRPCEANNYALTGSGSATDPYMICTMTDFMSMTAGSYYKLKKDLEYLGTPITTATKFAPGVYNLNGDGHTLIGITTELAGGTPAKIGLFNALQAGSKISDINFVGLNFKTTSSIGMNATTLQAGLLAGLNQGVIEKVHVENSSIQLQMDNGTNIDDAIPHIGGLVGVNHGLMQYIYGGPYVSIIDSTVLFNGGEAIYAGGLIGRNMPGSALKYSGLYSGIGHHANSGSFQNTKPNEHFYGAVVAYNSGTIEQVSSEGRVEIRNFDDNNAGGSFAGIAAKNDGIINNTSSQVTFRLNQGGSLSEFSGVVANNLAGGVVSKTYYSPSEWDMNDFGVPLTPGSGTVTVSSGTNAVVGVATNFLSMAVGDYVYIAGELHRVQSITDGTNMTLVNNHGAGAVSQPYSFSTTFPRTTNLAGVVLNNSGTSSDNYCFANSNAGEPNEGMVGCLNLHSTLPNFYFTAAGNGFDLSYDDASSNPLTLSSIGWNVDDDFMYGTAIWTIEDFDRPPRLRVSDPFRDEILNAPPIF